MATRSSVRAWRIPGTGEPGGLLPMGSHRVGHNWSDLAAAVTPEWGSLVTQLVKNLPAMWETWVWSLGQEDHLEKGMEIHSGILAWRIPWGEEPGGLQFMGSQTVIHHWVTFTITNPVWSHLNLLHLKSAYFLIKSHSEGPERTGILRSTVHRNTRTQDGWYLQVSGRSNKKMEENVIIPCFLVLLMLSRDPSSSNNQYSSKWFSS